MGKATYTSPLATRIEIQLRNFGENAIKVTKDFDLKARGKKNSGPIYISSSSPIWKFSAGHSAFRHREAKAIN